MQDAERFKGIMFSGARHELLAAVVAIGVGLTLPWLGIAFATGMHSDPAGFFAVFLLTAIAGVLGVISNRLARVLDRSRDLHGPGSDSQELLLLRRRMGLLSRAMECVSVTGVLVSIVVAVTFISAITVLDLAAIVVPLFVLAMLTLIAGLLLLLLDTRVASRMMRRRF